MNVFSCCRFAHLWSLRNCEKVENVNHASGSAAWRGTLSFVWRRAMCGWRTAMNIWGSSNVNTRWISCLTGSCQHQTNSYTLLISVSAFRIVICILSLEFRECFFSRSLTRCAVTRFLKINIYQRRPRSGGYIYRPQKDQRTEKLSPVLDNEAFEYGEIFWAGVIKMQTQTCMVCLGIREKENVHIKWEEKCFLRFT